MSQVLSKTLDISILPDSGIHIYKLPSWSSEGLAAWEASIRERLEGEAGKILSIYDMRHLDSISLEALEVVNRLESHPKSPKAYGVAVIRNRRLAILVDSVIGLRRDKKKNRVVSSLDEAVLWLLEISEEDQK